MEKEIMDKFIKENKEEIEIEYGKNWGVMLEAIITVAKNLYNWRVSLQEKYKKDKELQTYLYECWHGRKKPF